MGGVSKKVAAVFRGGGNVTNTVTKEEFFLSSFVSKIHSLGRTFFSNMLSNYQIMDYLNFYMVLPPHFKRGEGLC